MQWVMYVVRVYLEFFYLISVINICFYVFDETFFYYGYFFGIMFIKFF